MNAMKSVLYEVRKILREKLLNNPFLSSYEYFDHFDSEEMSKTNKLMGVFKFRGKTHGIGHYPTLQRYI